MHMKTTGLCFDNMKRRYERNPFSLIPLLSRLKHAGTRNISQFLFGSKVEYRATGLHFLSVKDYYSKLL